MGYSFDGKTGRLCCDSCGASNGKTRKRTCPYKVQYFDGTCSLPYCYPSALCPDCYATHKATLHRGCQEGAAKRTEENRISAERAKTDYKVRTAWGDWHETVPAGFVGVCFQGATGQIYKLIPYAHYNDSTGLRKLWLSEYPEVHPWIDPDLPRTKQVEVADAAR